MTIPSILWLTQLCQEDWAIPEHLGASCGSIGNFSHLMVTRIRVLHGIRMSVCTCTCTYLQYCDNELGSLFNREGLPEPVTCYEDEATEESEKLVMKSLVSQSLSLYFTFVYCIAGNIGFWPQTKRRWSLNLAVAPRSVLHHHKHCMRIYQGTFVVLSLEVLEQSREFANL